MKWSKFQDALKKHPNLANDLCWRAFLIGGLKEFVRTTVGFVAFRPFESLDFQSKSSSIEEPLTSEYMYTPAASYVSIEWFLVFHIELEDPGARSRWINSDHGTGTIQNHIDEIRQWHSRCLAFKGCQIIWERVVKRTVRGSSNTGLTEMNLEIYQFPPQWGFVPMPSAKPAPMTAEAQRNLEATRAYVRGEELPPIIPGAVLTV